MINYPGKELENFESANVWRKYIYFCVKKYLKKNILEVGAGIGSFTLTYLQQNKKITLTETDTNNFNIIKERFKDRNISIYSSLTKDLNEVYETIMYMNVLEHIEEDKKEIEFAISKLQKNGYLIILVPAHNKLYSKFDKAIGHYRRYEIDFFHNLKLTNVHIEKLCYLDCAGYFLYYINKIFFKEETYPSKYKIFIWDKIFTPFTILLDKLTGYKFGKNILCVIKKN